MVCYPVVMELFFNDGPKEINVVIYLSDVKNKNFETVQFFEGKCIEYVRELA